MSDRSQAVLQTLDRGIITLMMVARSPGGASVADIANELGVHRAIAYRIVATLEARGLVARSASGRILLGIAIPAIAHQFMPQFTMLAQPVLRDLATAVSATAFVARAEGPDCVAILVEQPNIPVLHVGYRVGSRHPLQQAAAGIAILAGRPARADDPAAVREARGRGYSQTSGQLQKGAVGIAVPLRAKSKTSADSDFSIGVVAMEDLDVERAITFVKNASISLSRMIGAKDATEDSRS
jgi:DNA-binding IclR family transcriptional regulator